MRWGGALENDRRGRRDKFSPLRIYKPLKEGPDLPRYLVDFVLNGAGEAEELRGGNDGGEPHLGLRPVVWIRTYQCCGSGMFIPDPNFFHHGSRIRILPVPDPWSLIKDFKYFNKKKLFLRLRKYDPGCSYRIRIFYPSRIQGSKRHRIPDLDLQHWDLKYSG